MNILGIGTLSSDTAAALLCDGKLVAAMEEAKVARRSVRGALPLAAIDECLRIGRIGADAVDIVAVVRPVAEESLHLALRERFPKCRLVVVGHHLAHAASAFYASPFEDATVLTLDRGGDLSCGARWSGSAAGLAMESEYYYPDSLADLYSRVTELLGFTADADEHKVQWLSASGSGKLAPLFDELMGAGDAPRFERRFFDAARLTRGGFSAAFAEALGAAKAEEIAAGLQKSVQGAVFKLAGAAKNLCLAGGLGFNALLVAALERSGAFENVFVQPAAGNAGTALGAVLHVWHEVLHETHRVGMGAYQLGPEYSDEEVKQVLENCKLRFRYLVTGDELVETAVEQITGNKIIAWMQGRMEFGPRALGNRSILASPLDPYSTENLNQFIKRREAFRKFAASVPAELAEQYFETGPNARHLATVGKVKAAHRGTFEAAVLGDGWIRVHTVAREENPLYWNLLQAIGRRTGLPVLYNTSFNLFGEPLVCSPRDAVRSFYASGVDALFAGNFYLEK